MTRIIPGEIIKEELNNSLPRLLFFQELLFTNISSSQGRDPVLASQAKR